MMLAGWRGHALLALVARVDLGGLFVLAAWHKVVAPAGFALDVATYQILPLSLVNLFALVLPWIELVAGAALLLGTRVRGAALLVGGMMLVFLWALVSALARGLDMSCGCFASQSAADPISRWTLARDLAWFCLALYVLAFDRRPLGLDRLIEIARARRHR